MKHKAHMNRFTALNTAMSVSFAAFGLFAASAASAENYISISSDAGVQRPNYNNVALLIVLVCYRCKYKGNRS